MLAYDQGPKLLADAVLAAILLLLAAPLIAGFAAAIALRDPGPVFFRQARIGRHGEPFAILKLRTMSPSGTEILRDFFEANPEARRIYEETGVIAEDPRIVSGAARFARKYYFDELPQLLNILMGDMSFVGPRPLEEWLARTLMSEQEMSLRASVRPGLTGLAQINRRSKGDIGRRMIRLDLLYVRRLSPGFDLSILLATPRTVLAGSGIEPAPA